MKDPRVKLRPAPFLLILALIYLLISTALYLWPDSAGWGPALSASLGGVLVLLALGEALWVKGYSSRLGLPEIRLEGSSLLALGRPNRRRLVMEGTGPHRRVLLHFPLPAGFSTTSQTISLEEDSPGPVVVKEVDLTPLERGIHHQSSPWGETPSPLGLWSLRWKSCPKGYRWEVYPDFKTLLTEHMPWQTPGETGGVRVHRRRGSGMEFLRLREYQRGDPLRFIDWKATSRRGKPMIKEFQEEQDQQILLLLDSGYRLHQPAGKMSRFDQVLHGALLLAHRALKHQDSLGVRVFGPEERRIPPRKGMAHMGTLLRGLFDIQSAPLPSSPAAALEEALASLKKRTLIILLTDLKEEDDASLKELLPLIPRRHLFLTLNLREREAEERASAVPRSFEAALMTREARRYLENRRRLTRLWDSAGIITLEASPEEIPRRLTEKYLELKSTGRF